MHSSRRTSLDSSGLRDRARGYSPRPATVVKARQISDFKVTSQQQAPHNPSPAIHKPQTQNRQATSPQQVRNQPASHHSVNPTPLHKNLSQQQSQPSSPQQQMPKNGLTTMFSAHKTHSKLMPTRRPQPVHKAMTTQAIAAVPTLPMPKVGLMARARSAVLTHKKGYALTAMAVLLFVAGAFVNVRSFVATQKLEAQVQAAADGGEDGRPGASAGYDETPVSVNTVSQYIVSPDMPRYLFIDKLSVFSRIKRVGVDAQNAVEAPKNVYDAGWYDGSAKPGESGAVFIDGHVSGPTRGGVFVNLKKLKAGDTIKVEMGNGIKYSYSVAATEKVPKDQVDMAKALRPYEQGKQGLNIMTCAGTYDKNSETYDYRFIVYAVRNN